MHRNSIGRPRVEPRTRRPGSAFQDKEIERDGRELAEVSPTTVGLPQCRAPSRVSRVSRGGRFPAATKPARDEPCPAFSDGLPPFGYRSIRIWMGGEDQTFNARRSGAAEGVLRCSGRGKRRRRPSRCALRARHSVLEEGPGAGPAAVSQPCRGVQNVSTKSWSTSRRCAGVSERHRRIRSMSSEAPSSGDAPVEAVS